MVRLSFNIIFVSFGLICPSFGHLYAADVKPIPESILLINETETDLEINYKLLKTVLKGRSEGIRHKRFTVFNINVYKAKLFFTDDLNETKDAAELLKSKTIAIKINPMRSFAGDKLKEAMTVSYEKNKIDSNSASQVEFLEMISKHKIEKDQPVFLVGVVNKDNEELHLIMNELNKKIIGGPGFVKEVFSVWLGEPVDSDMAKLKNTITDLETKPTAKP
jgi:hypothetical protein